MLLTSAFKDKTGVVLKEIGVAELIIGLLQRCGSEERERGRHTGLKNRVPNNMEAVKLANRIWQQRQRLTSLQRSGALSVPCCVLAIQW